MNDRFPCGSTVRFLADFEGVPAGTACMVACEEVAKVRCNPANECLVHRPGSNFADIIVVPWSVLGP